SPVGSSMAHGLSWMDDPTTDDEEAGTKANEQASETRLMFGHNFETIRRISQGRNPSIEESYHEIALNRRNQGDQHLRIQMCRFTRHSKSLIRSLSFRCSSGRTTQSRTMKRPPPNQISGKKRIAGH